MNQPLKKNALILTGAELISKGFDFVGSILLAQLLGVAQFGVLNFVFSVSFSVSLLHHFGFDQLVTRDIAKNRHHTGAYLVGICLTKLFLLLISFSFLIFFLEFFSIIDEDKNVLIYTGTGTAFFYGCLIFSVAFFRAHQLALHEALIRFTVAVFILVTSVAIAYWSGNIFQILAARGLVYATIFSVVVYLLIKTLKPHFSADHPPTFAYIKKSWPFAVHISFVYFYTSADIIILNIFKGDDATGLYSAAFKIFTVFTLIPLGIGNALLPALSASFSTNFENYKRVIKKSFFVFIALSSLFVTFNLIFAESIIVLLFGDEYLVSGTILIWLSWSLIPTFLSHLLNCIMLSSGQEKKLVLFSAIGALVNIALNFILIPQYSYYGAAISTIGTQSIVALSQFFFIRTKLLKQAS